MQRMRLLVESSLFEFFNFMYSFKVIIIYKQTYGWYYNALIPTGVKLAQYWASLIFANILPAQYWAGTILGWHNIGLAEYP